MPLTDGRVHAPACDPFPVRGSGIPPSSSPALRNRNVPRRVQDRIPGMPVRRGSACGCCGRVSTVPRAVQVRRVRTGPTATKRSVLRPGVRSGSPHPVFGMTRTGPAFRPGQLAVPDIGETGLPACRARLPGTGPVPDAEWVLHQWVAGTAHGRFRHAGRNFPIPHSPRSEFRTLRPFAWPGCAPRCRRTGGAGVAGRIDQWAALLRRYQARAGAPSQGHAVQIAMQAPKARAEPNPIRPRCHDNPTDMPQCRRNRAK